jgi:hypothetical protein
MEKQLKKIISESIKKVLNEIGDTAAGRLKLSSLVSKAEKEGRSGQAQKIMKYMHNKLPSEIKCMNDDVIVFVSTCKRATTVSIHNDGKVCLNNISTPYFNLREPMDISYISWFKTSASAARMVTNWIKKHFSSADAMYLDWHTWAKL